VAQVTKSQSAIRDQLILVLILESRKRALFSQRLIRQLKVHYWFGFYCGCLLFTYLESFYLGQVTKSKRNSKSIDTCTDFGKSKESFVFSKTNPPAESTVLIWFRLYIFGIILFGASKQKSKRNSKSIDTCTDFGKSKESFVFSKTNPPAESTLLIWFRLWLSCVYIFGINFWLW
jgi:hypothetical protein